MPPTPEGPTGADLTLLDPDGAFSARLAEDHNVLGKLARGFRAASPARRDRFLAEIEVLAHRLAGAAGTFGHGAVSAAAFELEHCIIAARGRSDGPDGKTIDRCLTGLLGALVHAIGPLSRAKGTQN